MRTRISNEQGVVTEAAGNGLVIGDREFPEAACDDRWEDLYTELHEGTGPAALTYEQYRDTGYFMHFFRHNQSDLIFMSYQMPHQWDTSTAVRPHLHYVPMATEPGNVRFDYTYVWTGYGDELSGSVGWTSGSIDTAVASSDKYRQSVISFGTLSPPAGAGASAILIMKVERDRAGIQDTYSGSKDHGTAAANVGVLFFDLHYRRGRPGTVNEWG